MRRFHYPSIGSTNDEARRLLSHYHRQPFLVTAGEQVAGRGRAGRTWCSPIGGAWMSLAWPLTKPADHYDPAPLIAALAVRDAVGDVIGRMSDPADRVELLLKWPNDLLLNGRKVAGVLCERLLRAPDPEQAGEFRGDFLIVGVGINADFDLTQLPESLLRYPATTLRASLGRPVDVEALIVGFRDRMNDLMLEFENRGLTDSLLDELRAALAFNGRFVEVSIAEGRSIRGRQIGVDDDGRLLVETAEGVQRCAVGEVSRVRVDDSAGGRAGGASA